MNDFKINRICSLQQLSLNPVFVDPTNSNKKIIFQIQLFEDMSRKIKVYYAHFIDETTEAQKGKLIFVRFKPTNEKLSLAASSSVSKVRISRTLIS